MSDLSLYEILDRVNEHIVICSSSAPWYVPLKSIERHDLIKDSWKLTFVFASGMHPVYAVVDRETILKLVRKYAPMNFYLKGSSNGTFTN